MRQCWKCSTELNGARCTHCGALNTFNDQVINGVIRDEEEVTVYVVEGSPGHLVVDLKSKEGRLSQMPRPDRPNALASKGFTKTWGWIIGDHPLLKVAKPQRFEIHGEKGSRLLFVEVHGLSDQPAAKITNGIDHDADDYASEEADAEASPESAAGQEEAAEETLGADAGGAAEGESAAQDADDAPGMAAHADEAEGDASDDAGDDDEQLTQDADEAPEQDHEAQGAQDAGGEQEADDAGGDQDEQAEHDASDDDAARSDDLAPQDASDDDAQEPAPEALPGMELASLPTAGVVDHVARLSQLKEEIALLSQDAKHAEAMARLRDVMSSSSASRRLAENLYLNLALGQAAVELGDEEVARSALARAFELDPRDRSVLEAYGTLLDGQTPDLSLPVDRNLLLHHRRQLDPTALSAAYRRLGRARRGQGDLERARVSYELALEARSDDRESLDELLETVKESGNVEHVIRVRQRLLDQMRDPKGRAMLRLAIGDDYHERLGDLDRAMEQYELAAEDHPNTTSLKRLVRLAMEAGQWRRATQAYLKMATLLPEPSDQATAYVQAAAVFQHHLGSSEQAARHYERALELNPEDLSPLEELVSMLAGGNQWRDLRGVYERMIERTSQRSDTQRDLIGVLWYKLGEVLRLHLQDLDAARKAYSAASEIQPDNAQLHALLAELYDGSGDEESLRGAVHHNRLMLESGDGLDPQAVERLGMAHLRLKEIDQAMCVFRVLLHGSEGTEQIRDFVTNHSTNIARTPNDVLSDEFFQTHLLKPHANYNTYQAEVFAIAGEAMIMKLNHDIDHYKLTPKNRIDRNDDLMFTKLYKKIAATMGIEAPPQVYHKAGLKGMFNAALYPQGFIVGDDMLSGATEKQQTFTIAKQLFLSRPESELFQLYPFNHLNIFFHIILKTLNPKHNIELNNDMMRLSNAIKKLKPEKLKRVGEALVTLSKQSKVDIEGQQRAYEDAANCVGLLFCEDLDDCQKAISMEPRPIAAKSRDVADRMNSLMRWTLSPTYHELRRQLGLSL